MGTVWVGGASGRRCHDLRHSRASLLLADNVHPKFVQGLLDHSQVAMTMDIYSHVMPGLPEQATDGLAWRLAT